MTLLHQILCLPFVHVYATAWEWAVHRYLFHGLGKRKGSVFAFHYVEHHRDVRRQGGGDSAYLGSPLRANAYGRECAGLLLLVLLHSPVATVAPVVFAYMAWRAREYQRLHRKSHLDPVWAREHLPWHWDHHMGPVADANWCVTCGWFDTLMGTRVPQTPKQSIDQVQRT